MKVVKLVLSIVLATSIAAVAVNALPASNTPAGSAVLTADVEPATPDTLPDAPSATQTPESTQNDEQPGAANEVVPSSPQPVVEDEAEAVVEVPVTVTGSIVNYQTLSADPSQQSITCTYSFSDGTTKVRNLGFRSTPGNGVPRLDVECPDWR